MNTENIRIIIDQYAGHGWQLRLILLSPEGEKKLRDYFRSEHPETPVKPHQNDALWFSRRSLPDREAWELRRLSDSPFALVVVLEDSLDDAARSLMLSETEERMFDPSRREPLSH